MERCLLFFFLILSSSVFAQTANQNDYRTKPGQTNTAWATTTNWEICSNSGGCSVTAAVGTGGWGTIATAPTGAAGVTIYITRNFSSRTTPFTLNGNLIVSLSVTFTISAVTGSTNDFVVSSTGSLTNNGTINLASSTGSNFTILTINSDLTNTGTINATNNNSGLLFSSGTTQSISGGTINVLLFEIDGATTVNNNATIKINAGGGTIIMDGAGNTLNANGSGSGNLTLQSTSSNAADAAIGFLTGGDNITGNVSVERYISQNASRIYHYLSPPVGTTVAEWQNYFAITGNFTGHSTTDPSTGTSTVCGQTMVGTSASMYTYDASTQLYVDYPTTSIAAALTPGTGYIAYIRNCTTPITLVSTGVVTQGPQTYTLTYNSGDTETWNLVGNPFPSPIDWGYVVNDPNYAFGTDVNAVVSVPDNTSGSLVYQYVDGGVGAGSDEYIALGQAFWVSTTGSGTDITIDELAKIAGTSTTFYRTQAKKTIDRLTIALSNGTVTDKTAIRLDSRAKTTFDRFDGVKLDNQLFDISTLSKDSVSLIVNATDSVSCGSVIKIKTKDMTAGSYTMSFTTEGVFNQYTLMLKDAYTGQNVSTAQPYSFTVDASEASQALDRFQLLVSLPDAAITQVNDSTLQANYSSGIQWYYNGTLLPDTTATLVAKKSGTYKFVATVGTCSSTSREASVALITALEPNNKLVSGYPNPVSSIYTLELPQDGSSVSDYPVLNSQGMNVGTIMVSETGDSRKGQFDFSSYPAGLYLIRTSQNGVIKIIKK